MDGSEDVKGFELMASTFHCRVGSLGVNKNSLFAMLFSSRAGAAGNDAWKRRTLVQHQSEKCPSVLAAGRDLVLVPAKAFGASGRGSQNPDPDAPEPGIPESRTFCDTKPSALDPYSYS